MCKLKTENKHVINTKLAVGLAISMLIIGVISGYYMGTASVTPDVATTTTTTMTTATLTSKSSGETSTITSVTTLLTTSTFTTSVTTMITVTSTKTVTTNLTESLTNNITTFDFDTGSPALSVGQNTPFNQTSGGVTAWFSSSSDPAAYSIQSRSSTFFTLSQFSGNYLYPNKLTRSSLDIRFSQPITSINLTFATIESHGPGNVETPSNITLTAYLINSTQTALLVSRTSAQGTFSSDSYPQGTLAFNSENQPFNLVRIELPVQLLGATTFLLDNITITRA